MSTPGRGAGSLVSFFVLTFAVTWTCFITLVRSTNAAPGAPSPPWHHVVLMLGIFAPALVALALTVRGEGSAGVGTLLGRIARFNVDARWYAFALGYMVVIKLVAALVHRAVLGTWPQLGTEPWFVMLAAIPVSTFVQAGEELGWRGYALPRLAERFGLGPAAIVLGVFWAAWHLPLFYLVGADTHGQSFVVYLFQVIAISVAMAWLYWRTHMSLILVMLMHAAINNTKDIIPSLPRAAADPFSPHASSIAWIGVAVMWAVAAWFLVQMRGAKLTPHADGGGTG